jgi:pimeloyl-ACP methyl ester carboxylesterase
MDEPSDISWNGPEAPRWFLDALAAPVEVDEVHVDGVPVRYRAWGERDAPGLVLVHGGAAHGRWWDHVAPLLATGRRVVAVDLSGHGDSGRRTRYDLDGWAEETIAAAAHAGAAGPVTLVGHSMGGYVVLRAASRHAAELTGVVAIDSPVREISPEQLAAREQRAFGPLRVYPTREAALARSHPVPEEGPTLPYVMAHVADTSVRAVDGGWSWKFDPAIFGRPPLPPSLLTRLECRVALFRAEHGMLTEQLSDVMYDRLGRTAPVIEIPDAWHHVMLLRPLALVTALRTLLADWDHSRPVESAH